MKAWGAVPERFRTPLATAAGLALVLMITRLIPSQAGTRGAPTAILFQGLVFGLVNGLTAGAIVLVYRTTRILNFAQTAIGAGGAAICFNLLELSHAPFWLALPSGLAAGAAVGALFDIVFGRRFLHAPRLVLTVFTIVAAGFLTVSSKQAADLLPIFPPTALRTLDQLQGKVPLKPLLPAPGFRFTFPDLRIPFGFAELFSVVIAVLALAALAAFLRYTRAGVAIRALAENLERASLLGISVGLLSTLVWSIAGVFSALTLSLTGVLTLPAQATGLAPEVLLPSLAAAVLARMRSLGVAVAASVGISWLSGAVAYLEPDWVPLVTGVLLVVTAAGLLLQSRRPSRSELAASTWSASEELRPVPIEMVRLTGIRLARWGLILTALAGVLIFPFVADTGQLYLGASIAVEAIVGISLVILTGWAGQVSLGQFGLVAIGAVVAAGLTTHLGVNFWLAVPAGALFTAGLAMLIGLPALRIPGLFLGVATFAFAAAVSVLLFNQTYFGWLLPPAGIPRPTLFLINFDDQRAMYFLCLAALALTIAVVISLRRTRFGRLVITVRDNESHAESMGISALGTKLAAFGLSGLLAGLAGGLLAFLQQTISPPTFAPAASIGVFTLLVVGGVGSLWGPLLGSVFVNAVRFGLAGVPDVAATVNGGLALTLLYFEPGGLLALLAQVRDSVLRIIAHRNQLVVPSLFADMDPEALHLRLIPMAAPLPRSGRHAVSGTYDLSESVLSLPHRQGRRPEREVAR